MKQILAALAATLLTAQVASAAGFWDQGMVLGKARFTEYPSGEGVGHNINLWYPEPTPEGCLFPATGNQFGCPGRDNLGNTTAGGHPGLLHFVVEARTLVGGATGGRDVSSTAQTTITRSMLPHHLIGSSRLTASRRSISAQLGSSQPFVSDHERHRGAGCSRSGRRTSAQVAPSA